MKRILIITFCYLAAHQINGQMYVPGGYTAIGNANFKIYPSGNAGTSGALKLQFVPGGSSTILQANSDVVWANHDIIINGANTTDGNINQFVVHRSGNVGIGTATPQAKLEVYSNAVLGAVAGNYVLLNKFYSVAGDEGNNFNDNTWLYRGAAGSNWVTARLHKGISIDGSYGVPGVSTRTWWERAPSQDIQSFGTGSTAYLTIKAGNVGIGTTEPGAFRLAVEGKIGASEVVVTLARPWPDYVFENAYKLPSLSELELFIKANKHLPDVPTAEEVKDNGLSMGEMNVILLKKVEELTLYVIELKRQNDEVSQIVREMQEEIDLLKK